MKTIQEKDKDENTIKDIKILNEEEFKFEIKNGFKKDVWWGFVILCIVAMAYLMIISRCLC